MDIPWQAKLSPGEKHCYLTGSKGDDGSRSWFHCETVSCKLRSSHREKRPMSEISKLFIKHSSVLETKQDFPRSLKVLSTQGRVHCPFTLPPSLRTGSSSGHSGQQGALSEQQKAEMDKEDLGPVAAAVGSRSESGATEASMDSDAMIQPLTHRHADIRYPKLHF